MPQSAPRDASGPPGDLGVRLTRTSCDGASRKDARAVPPLHLVRQRLSRNWRDVVEAASRHAWRWEHRDRLHASTDRLRGWWRRPLEEHGRRRDMAAPVAAPVPVAVPSSVLSRADSHRIRTSPRAISTWNRAPPLAARRNSLRVAAVTAGIREARFRQSELRGGHRILATSGEAPVRSD